VHPVPPCKLLGLFAAREHASTHTPPCVLVVGQLQVTLAPWVCQGLWVMMVNKGSKDCRVPQVRLGFEFRVEGLQVRVWVVVMLTLGLMVFNFKSQVLCTRLMTLTVCSNISPLHYEVAALGALRAKGFGCVQSPTKRFHYMQCHVGAIRVWTPPEPSSPCVPPALPCPVMPCLVLCCAVLCCAVLCCAVLFSLEHRPGGTTRCVFSAVTLIAKFRTALAYASWLAD
jgi:hypothetical protein